MFYAASAVVKVNYYVAMLVSRTVDPKGTALRSGEVNSHCFL